MTTEKYVWETVQRSKTEAKNALKEAFQAVGKMYNYGKVDAEFTAFRDFKVKWTRSYQWADFTVSDYLNNAPMGVLEGLAESLFSRISGREPKPYTPEMNDWITAPEFRDEKQPVYIRRSMNITRSAVGQYKDLDESLDRLKEKGLVAEDIAPYLTWTKSPLQRNIGYASTLMDVIVISAGLDKKGSVSDTTLDLAVFRELQVIKDGWDNFGNTEYAEKVKSEDDFIEAYGEEEYESANGFLELMMD